MLKIKRETGEGSAPGCHGPGQPCQVGVLHSIGYRVGLHQHGGLLCQLLFLLNVVADVTEFLLHHPYRLEVGRVVEGIAAQKQELTEQEKHSGCCYMIYKTELYLPSV